jgi:hypothetical protein
MRLGVVLVALVSLPAAAAVVQHGNLRITVIGQVSPYRLPRVHPAPIAVFVSGHIASVDHTIPPQLERLVIRVNRHGRLQDTGLPICQLPEIQPGSTGHALENCGAALVGSGQFWAHIILPDQRPYPTSGRLLIFNGRRGGRPVIFAHIYSVRPFATSFVVTFAIKHVGGQGTYGTELAASLPSALGDWGYVDRIKLTLKRKYRYRGRWLSYFNASCPAPAGIDRAAYPLASTRFSFVNKQEAAVAVIKDCRVKP